MQSCVSRAAREARQNAASQLAHLPRSVGVESEQVPVKHKSLIREHEAGHEIFISMAGVFGAAPLPLPYVRG